MRNVFQVDDIVINCHLKVGAVYPAFCRIGEALTPFLSIVDDHKVTSSCNDASARTEGSDFYNMLPIGDGGCIPRKQIGRGCAGANYFLIDSVGNRAYWIRLIGRQVWPQC